MGATATATAPYLLRKPCADCPFRSDKKFPLRPGRAKEFADNLRDGGTFMCHKTVEFIEDDETGESDQRHTEASQFCAGALITMEREGFSNQVVRIAERLGSYDPSRLDMTAPVYGSLAEWVRSYSDGPPTVTTDDGEVLEFEHCGVVGDDCEDPAGYAFGGGVSANDDEPTCNPLTDACTACGNTMCSACRATPSDDPDGSLCIYCAEED